MSKHKIDTNEKNRIHSNETKSSKRRKL